MNIFIRRLPSHFATLEQKTKWGFLWRTWLEATLAAFIVANLLQFIYHFPLRSDLVDLSPWRLALLVIVVGPLVETLIFQFLLIETAQGLKWKRAWQFLCSIIPFALAHALAGISTVISAGIIGGFFFAFTYYRWKRESLLIGILMTFLLHASFNTTGVIGMLLLGH